MCVIIGIDPGAKGAIAFMDKGETMVVSIPETDKDIEEILRWYPGERKFAVLEQVHATKIMGVSNAFAFGGYYRCMRMALSILNIPYELVTPQRWQKDLGIIVRGSGKKLSEMTGKDRKDKKAGNRAKAQQLFPDIKITNDNADALLIAYWARGYADKMNIE